MKANIYLIKVWNGIRYDKNGNITCELINGCGKIKKYYDNGNLEFEGEYFNGLINGKGKEYNFKGQLLFKANI